MKRWPIKPLGELVLPTEQRDPRLKPSEEFSYVDIAGVDNETKTIATTKRIVGVDAPSRARKVIRKGDVIVSTVRPNLNAVALVPTALDNQICSTGFSVLRPAENMLSGYLFAFSRSPFFIESLVARTTGANYPAVNDGEVKDVPIPIPPLPEQERIVKLLDKADELRKLRAQADRRTAALIPALFHEMFGVPLANSLPYPVKQIGELVREGDKINYGVVQPGDEVSDGIPIVRAGDFDGMSIDREHLKCISPEVEKNYSRSRLRGDEILISCVGSIGSVALADPSLAGCNIVRAVARVPLHDEIDRVFVASQLMTPELQHFFRRETRTVAQPTLNIRQIEETPIILPPLVLQKEFAQRVTEIRELESTQAASRASLDALFQSMLHSAFNGEL